jgi:hypothetical protein
MTENGFFLKYKFKYLATALPLQIGIACFELANLSLGINLLAYLMVCCNCLGGPKIWPAIDVN